MVVGRLWLDTRVAVVVLHERLYVVLGDQQVFLDILTSSLSGLVKDLTLEHVD